MYSNSILAVTGALLSVVAAVPMADNHHHHHHAKRDIVWVTQTEEQVVTVPITKTVWIEPGETPPSQAPAAPAASSSEAPPPQAYVPPPQQAAPASSSAPAAPVPYQSPSSQEQAPAPSSQYVAPSPSSTYVPPPAPATTEAAPAPASSSAPASQAPAPASSSAPAASYGSGSSGSSSGVSGMAAPGKSYTGDLTNYDVSAGLGSCGESMSPSENVVAVSHVIMSAYNGGNPNKNPLCNTKVNIKGVDGSMYTGTILDTCPGCGESSLDLSLDFFNKVTNNGNGRVHDIEWSFA